MSPEIWKSLHYIIHTLVEKIKQLCISKKVRLTELQNSLEIQLTNSDSAPGKQTYMFCLESTAVFYNFFLNHYSLRCPLRNCFPKLYAHHYKMLINITDVLPICLCTVALHKATSHCNSLSQEFSPPWWGAIVSTENTWSLRDGEIMLGYPDGSTLITWVLKSKELFLALVRKIYYYRRRVRKMQPADFEAGGRGQERRNVGSF